MTFASEELKLGRKVEHDARSLSFAVAGVPISSLKSVRWKRRSPILDQGSLGSCTGNAGAGWLATDNSWRAGSANVTEAVAVDLYSSATHLDEDKSEAYPPTDCGSSGLGLAKALKARKSASAYHHAFSLQACLTALQKGPVPLGIEWLEAMFKPSSSGSVKLAGAVAGGHEILIEGYDAASKEVVVANSWGRSWSPGLGGYFVLTLDQLADRLDAQGDAIQLTAVVS